MVRLDLYLRLARSVGFVCALTGVILLPGAQAPKPEAGKNPAGKAVNSKSARPSTRARGGVVASVDPETGQLQQPTAQDLDSLGLARRPAKGDDKRAASSERAVEQVVSPDGEVTATVDESLHVFTVVKRNADGSVSLRHAQGRKAAEAALTTGKDPKKPEATGADNVR